MKVLKSNLAEMREVKLQVGEEVGEGAGEEAGGFSV